jgi:pimeloyl-ACP methyl ester carboxylesterase
MTPIVAVHGLWMRGASMAALRWRLEPKGFEVHAFSYPSVRAPLAANAAALAAFVERVPGDVVHLVGHSLGGVLILAMLEQCVPARLGRVVCLGSPFGGSVSAARLACWPGGRRLVGRCIGDLNVRGGFDAWRAPIEVGIIAGSVPLGAGRLLGRFSGPNDGTVAVAETRLRGAHDHIVLPVTHMALLWSAEVAKQIGIFLAHGRFDHAADR